jgi:hypothetical protein
MNVRSRALGQVLLFGLIFAGGVTWLTMRHSNGIESPFDQILFHAFFLPGGLAIAGLLQLVTGVPFSQWSSRWDSLQGWQRGVFGSLLVLVLLGCVFAGMAVYGLYFFH